MKDPGVPEIDRLDRVAQHPMALGPFLRFAVGLSAAVGDVHRRGIVHKDIKPAHVLVNSATGEISLTGFGIASRLRRERQSPEPPEFISGTLPYMAPEQTGRMNRSIDSRADLYGVGVTLYEVLIGALPFVASDPLEWIHCHVARRAVPPAERRRDIPGVVSAIIMKLLAKTAEDRYQTAAGLERDLRRCLAAWDAERRIDPFALGEQDVPDLLLIPQKLYGREREIEALRAAFDRVVASGTPEMVLVSGYSGIGKSSVVNELHKVLVSSRGLFASGKFDQYKRDVPYATLAQAFQGLVRGLLAKSELELAPWRDALLEALRPNGRLMVDLVPQLALIIGEQPAVAEFSPQDGQRRFHLVVRRFVGVFAQSHHPLVIFLDDLQWLDAATREIVEALVTHPDVRHVLLIGAYRDNEVDPSHPVMRTVDVIRKAGVAVQEINLAPIDRERLSQLVSDALHTDSERVATLTQLVHERTAGNPFFVIRFLQALAEEKLLAFAYDTARWSWDLDRIRAKGYTDNVVDLMAARVIRLPAAAQAALQQLACIGNAATVGLLASVHGTTEAALHAVLEDAVHTELLERRDDVYGFVHDRIQEAAYSLIPARSRVEAHLRIGRLLAAQTPPDRREEAIFEIVNQLNRGAALLTSRIEREQLAELNLDAGKRAKASTAYASALTYLVAGAALLADDAWDRRPELAVALELHRAECEFLTGEYAAADARLSSLSRLASTPTDRAAVTRLRAALFTTLDRPDRAIAVGLDYLREAGIDWPSHPTMEALRDEYARIWQQLGDRPIEALIDLPLMRDPQALAAMDVLTEIITPAVSFAPHLAGLVAGRMTNLSLAHGNCHGSCFAYVHVALVLGTQFGDYQAGFRLGSVALELVDTPGLDRFTGRVYKEFGAQVLPWTRHHRIGRTLVRRAFDAALARGDLTFAAYSRNNLIAIMLASGDPLADIQREAERGLAFAHTVGIRRNIDILTAQLGLVRTLRGLTDRLGSFNDRELDEGAFEQRLEADARLVLPACWYWIRKMQARVVAGDYGTALDAAAKAQRILWVTASFTEVAEYHFYGAIAHAASCDAAPDGRRPAHVEALRAHARQLAAWAVDGPENFGTRSALADAEIARLDGRDLEAMRLYETSIRLAREHGFIHLEALADEVAARFYRARGFATIADAYVGQSRSCYVRWGATGKVRQLDASHPHLRIEPSLEPATTIDTPVEHLDLATVLKVAEAVSGEIVLEKLIDVLLRTAFEHAGAERGLLILPHGDSLRIEAEASVGVGGAAVRLRSAIVSPDELPESVLHYAARTHDSVLLADASASGAFTADAYIRGHEARSILCLPLVKQGRLIGLLYLENHLAAGVFTPARIAVLNAMASQAAISLENSRLYRELEQREAKIRRLVDANVVGVWVSAADGRIVEANDAFLQVVARTRDDVTSGRLRWQALAPPEWLRVTERAFEQVGATGRREVFETEYVRPDGSRVPVLVGAAAIDGGPGAEIVAFVLDLTERKRGEDRLRQAQADLAYMSRVTTLGELSASLAHELKQPIAAAMTNAHTCERWLRRETPDLAEASEAASRVVSAIKRAGEIVDRVRLLYTRGTPHRELVDVNDVVRGMIDLLRPEANRRAIAIRADLADGLPGTMADRVQLQQVLMNLMLNGIEAMVDMQGELVITSKRTADRQLLIAVSDSGVGIGVDEADRMFDAFFTTKSRGTGMGLSISRTIVESHGGRLWASANTTRGTTFQFTLRAM
ncbi:MAG: histidine kinase [Acidobacteria bacterium]|nr:histidine kinase [Acidobacteriota bacterium]